MYKKREGFGSKLADSRTSAPADEGFAASFVIADADATGVSSVTFVEAGDVSDTVELTLT
jgi:hypothetical protein